tara:strand:- start:320 stop:2584 length:2265 start_codon:yes stop_codon:yes gene_type:complete
MKDALDRFEESQDGSEENREAYYEDIKFARAADQWPDAIKKQRIQEARPVLVINKLPPLIRAVVNESRQNKPAIKVAPVDNGADEDTAEVIGGIIRSVERVSNASVAYDTAIDHAVTAGFGFFRISIDYAHDESFDLEAIIDRIPNALMVHWDVTSTKFDASDWEYAFISEKVGERDFERRYPDASKVPFDGDTRNDGSDNWISDDDIRLAEYFLRVSVQRKLLQLQVPSQEGAQPDIVAVREDDVPMMAQRFLAAGGIDANPEDPHLTKEFFRIASIQVLQERDVEAHKVERRIMNGQEVLEEDEWPGSMIPICPVWGDEIYIDGRRTFRSMIRDAKDPQVMLNFWRSATTELVALAPKAPWVGPKGFIPKGDESKWRSANTRSHAYLEYDPAAGAPARQEFAGVPSGALNEGMMANDDMKAITGIYDPSLGAEANEKSGVAIRARQNQGDISNFHFIDNLSRAIGYCGNCLLEIIPAIYSARQTVRILGEDQAENVVKLTQQAGGAKQKQADGDEALYNLTVGKYDVSVSQGPSFASQREETRETLIEIMRQVPDAAAFLGDVLLDHMDFVGADKVAKRLKGLLPPEVRQAEEDADSGKDPEVSRLQQQLKAQGQEHEQIKGQVMQEIEKLQAELEKEKANNQAAMAKAQSDADLKGRELELKGRELVIKENEAVTAAQKVELTPEQEEAIRQDEQTFQAEENAKDRRVDLAKSIIAKIEDDDDVEVQSAVARKAMGQADDILTATRPAPGD